MKGSGTVNIPVHLRRGGVSLVLAYDDRDLPMIVHWGADLGELSDDHLADLV